MRDRERSKPRAISSKSPHSEIRWRDEAQFIRTWLDRPRLTGAVSPSGRKLAARVAFPVDPSGIGPVIELGPGTGPVTEALLERGIAPERLVLIEFNPDFCRALAQRFPQLRIIQGDAYSLRETLAAAGIDKAAAIVSSLPLLTHSELKRLRLLSEAFELLEENGPFIQFTYGMLSPIPMMSSSQPITGIVAEVSPVIWHNLPPARVWTYRSKGFAFDPDCDYANVSIADLMRNRARNWRNDKHVKPAFDLLKRISTHFDR